MGVSIIAFYYFTKHDLLDINIQIALNEESIGYDWMLFNKVKEIMKHEDEKKAFDLI